MTKAKQSVRSFRVQILRQMGFADHRRTERSTLGPEAVFLLDYHSNDWWSRFRSYRSSIEAAFFEKRELQIVSESQAGCRWRNPCGIDDRE